MGFLRGTGILTGLAIGVGVTVVGSVIAPAMRPLGKSLIKAGLQAYDQAQVAFAELTEMTDDMVAEARAEMEAEQAVAAKEQEATRAASADLAA